MMDFECMNELIYKMGYDAILYLTYEPEENTFYDECGFRIVNIFEIISPNDLLLFRHDSHNCCFLKRDEYDILVVIS